MRVVSGGFFLLERGCFVLDITNEHGRASGHGMGVKGCNRRARTGAHKKGPDEKIYMNKQQGERSTHDQTGTDSPRR